MQLSSQQQVLNGNLILGNQSLAIARDSDFQDMLTFTPRETQFRAANALKDLCANFGENRSAMTDLYRQRLHEMRTHLRIS